MSQTLHRKRFLTHGVNALVLSIAVVGALVVGYVLVDRYRPFRWDLTKQGVHSLSPKTKEILARLERDIEITFFRVPDSASPEAGFVNQKVLDLLEEYQVRSKGKITYQDRSIFSDELLMAELGADPGSAVFRVGEAKIVVQAKDIFQTSWGGFGEEGPSTKFTGEEAFDQAILQLLEGKSRTACFLAGHGEPSIEGGRDPNGLTYAKELLRRENFDSKEITLAAGGGAELKGPVKLDAPPEVSMTTVPSDCTVLVIAGPKAPLSASDADAIVKYWESGRGVVVFAEPLTDSGVDKLVARFGIEMLPGVAADPAGQTRSPLAMIPEYGRHPIVDALNGEQIATVLIKAGGFRTPMSADSSIVATPILKTSPEGLQLTEIQQGSADPSSPKNIKGPINLGYAIEKKISEEKTLRAVVIGDVDFARNASIEAMAAQGAPGNIDLLKNSVHWSAGAAEKIGIGPKDPEFNPVTISLRGQLWVLALTALVLPATIFGAGVTVWLRRRRR